MKRLLGILSFGSLFSFALVIVFYRSVQYYNPVFFSGLWDTMRSQAVSLTVGEGLSTWAQNSMLACSKSLSTNFFDFENLVKTIVTGGLNYVFPVLGVLGSTFIYLIGLFFQGIAFLEIFYYVVKDTWQAVDTYQVFIGHFANGYWSA